jgi:CRISPR/Cas system endoribonuclease Cas6 (RAMP superfamily)
MHPHDKKWVDEQLAMLPARMRRSALDKYEAVYAETLAKNANSIAAEGMARREANSRLMEYVHRASRMHEKMRWA